MVRAESAASAVSTRCSSADRALRNPARICSRGCALWLASSVFRFVRSATVSRSLLPAMNSPARTVHKGSRSSRCPACSCADHFCCGLRSRSSRERPRTISSSLAGVPRKRTHTLACNSTGKEKSKVRSNHTGTLPTGFTGLQGILCPSEMRQPLGTTHESLQPTRRCVHLLVSDLVYLV